MSMNSKAAPPRRLLLPRRSSTPSPARADLLQREDLLFEIGTPETTGVDLPKPKGLKNRLGGVSAQGRYRPRRASPSRKPCATTCACRQKNYAIDLGLFPLGSCTMKHNPRLNEKMARLPGFADIHPLQPQATVQGALELIEELADLADDADRHAGGRDEPEGRRAWRAVRHAGDPRRR